MKQNTDRSAADQDEKPERVQAQHKAARFVRHVKRELKKLQYEAPKREEFIEHVMTLIQQGG